MVSFGNALDNAIEASEKLPADQRLITVKAGMPADAEIFRNRMDFPPDLW